MIRQPVARWVARGCAVGCVVWGLLVAPTPSQPKRVIAADDEIAQFETRERFVDAFTRAVAQARELETRDGALGPRTLAALERAGTLAHRAGALDLAERILELTLARRTELHGPDSPEVAESLLHRGTLARVADDRELAQRCIERALEIVEPLRSQRPRLYANLLAARASWLRQVDLDAAIEEYERALAARLADPDAADVDVADDLTWLGWSLFHRGRHAEARDRLDQAEVRLRAAGLTEHTLMGVIVSARADERAIHGEWAVAERLYSTSTAIFDSARRGFFPGFARRKSPRHGYSALALAALMQGREGDAFSFLERGRGAVTEEFLDFARWPEIDPAGYADVARRRRAWIEAEHRTHAPGDEPGSDVRRMIEALERYASVLVLERSFLDGMVASEPSLARLQAALAPQKAYVGWEAITLGDEHRASRETVRHETWAYVVRPDGIRWIPLVRAQDGPRPLEAQILRYVATLRRAASWPMRVDRDDELGALGADLAQVLLEPVLRELGGVDRLIIEQSDLVPFLPVESIRLHDGTCLKERYAVSYAPSAAMYLRVRQLPPRAATARPALAIGDPRLAETVGRQLPFARREVESVATLFPSATTLRGAAANELALERLASAGRLREFGVIHVAAHMVSPWLHERAALRLAPGGPSEDGFVELPEILAEWRLDADLVTLSGCRSVTGHVFPERGEYLGFPQALFAAGARAVLASTWEVDDEAAALLMHRFYENLTGARAQPMSMAEALREASLWLRDAEDEHGARPFEHPVYWSGFILLGAPD